MNSFKGSSSRIIENVPYTVHDGAGTQGQAPVEDAKHSNNTSNTASSTYSFSSPQGYSFIRTFRFTSEPSSTAIKGAEDILSSISSVILPIMLLSAAKILSGASWLITTGSDMDPLNNKKP